MSKIKMMMKTMSTPSMIQSFARLGINFLKMRSEVKAITATRSENPTKIPEMSRR